jgi:hypothetical protein
MIINMSEKYVVYVKEEVCAMISFGESFQNKQVYPFFQIKNIGASVKINLCDSCRL